MLWIIADLTILSNGNRQRCQIQTCISQLATYSVVTITVAGFTGKLYQGEKDEGFVGNPCTAHLLTKKGSYTCLTDADQLRSTGEHSVVIEITG